MHVVQSAASITASFATKPATSKSTQVHTLSCLPLEVSLAIITYWFF